MRPELSPPQRKEEPADHAVARPRAAQAPSSTGRRWHLVSDYTGLLAVLAGLTLIFALSTEHFFTLITFRTIANQIPDAAIIAVGMTFVLLIGGIDLSVGSVLALSGAILGVTMVEYQYPLVVAAPVSLLVGAICGAINGLVSARWLVPSFIVTLGMLEIARGGAYLVTGSETKYIGAPVEVITDLSVLGLSFPFLLAVLVVALGQLLLSRTIFGRYMIAIGTNEEAVRLSGIDPRPVKLAVFILSSTLAAVAAILHTARLAAADPNAGTGYELQAIAAVVIGGTSLMGGRGSVVRSFLGVLIIAVLGSGLAQLGVEEPTKRVVTGGVIVIAVILDYYRHHLGRRRKAGQV